MEPGEVRVIRVTRPPATVEVAVAPVPINAVAAPGANGVPPIRLIVGTVVYPAPELVIVIPLSCPAVIAAVAVAGVPTAAAAVAGISGFPPERLTVGAAV